LRAKATGMACHERSLLAYELHSDSPLFDDLVLSGDSPSTTIGRSRSATYRLHHPQISGTQCEIIFEVDPPQLRLKDLSSNGTFVDGDEVGKGCSVDLEHGSVITFLVPSIEDRDEEYGDAIPAFHVMERWGRKATGPEGDDSSGPLALGERLRPPPPVVAAARPRRRAAAACAAAARLTSLEACKLEPAPCRVLRSRPVPLAPLTPAPSSRRRRLAATGSRGVPVPPSRLLLLPSDLLCNILFSLDTPSLLRASCACARLRAESTNAPRLRLSALLSPLTLRRGAALFGRFPCLTELSLAGCALTDDGAAAVVSGLLPGLRTLQLHDNNLTVAGASALGGALRRCPPSELCLTHLDLSSARLLSRPTLAGHTTDAEPVLRMLQQLGRAAPTLLQLRLAHNLLRAPVAEAIATGPLMAPGAALQSLDLSGNYLGDAGVAAVARALGPEGGSRLRQLRLDRTFASDGAASALGEMLMGNSTLLQVKGSGGWGKGRGRGSASLNPPGSSTTAARVS
jgi:hypothetical protein